MHHHIQMHLTDVIYGILLQPSEFEANKTVKESHLESQNDHYAQFEFYY